MKHRFLIAHERGQISRKTRFFRVWFGQNQKDQKIFTQVRLWFCTRKDWLFVRYDSRCVDFLTKIGKSLLYPSTYHFCAAQVVDIDLKNLAEILPFSQIVAENKIQAKKSICQSVTNINLSL